MFVACSDTKPEQSASYPFNYVLDNPTQTIKLSNALEEISGIALLNEQTVLAIQDELGCLFWLDVATESVTRRLYFAEKADYEDLAIVGDSVYVLQASGRLHRIPLQSDSTQVQSQVVESGLAQGYDTEGLVYDARQNALWIACKDSPMPKKISRYQREIFAFSLSSHQLRPQLTLTTQAIDQYLTSIEPERAQSIRQRLSALKQPIIEPSALAFHPQSGDVYVVSATSQLLAIVQPGGQIAHIEPLPEAIFEQPEGIAFSPQGDLWMASEGKKRKARIYRFAPITPQTNPK